MAQTHRPPLIYEARDDGGSDSGRTVEVIYKDDGLLATAGPIMVLCYLLMLAIAAVTFFESAQALFVISVCLVFGVVYFAIPCLFLKIRAARDHRWQHDDVIARDPMVEVGTGSIHRWEAVIQIVSVPVAILIGFSLFALRWYLL